MDRSRKFGILCLIGATGLWVFPGVFVKHFALQKMHPDVQNLFRYVSATVGLWVLVLLLFGAEALRAWRRWYVFLLPAGINCVFQVVMVAALYRKSIYPAFASLLTKCGVVFSVVLAFVLFDDERATILSRRFLVGSALTIFGVGGVVLFGAQLWNTSAPGGTHDFAVGVCMIILQAFLWSCYTLAMKHVVRDTRPLVSFAIVATYTTLFFAVLAFIRSDPVEFLDISTTSKVLVVFSGLALISVTHSLYFRAVERLGVGICASFLLVTPLFTGLASWAWHGEKLQPAQILMGGVLLGGAFLVVTAGSQARNGGADKRARPAAAGAEPSGRRNGLDQGTP